jgi:ATP-dependent Clp protease ATP-binding subunit ClpA
MAAIKLMVDTNKQELAFLQQEFEQIKSNVSVAETDRFADYKWLNSVLQNKISPVLLGKLEDPVQTDKFETSEELDRFLVQSLQALQLLADDKKSDVTKEDIASVISHKTGIPLGKIQAQEKDKLLNMDSHLKRRVIGQDYAVKAICESILQSRSGLNKKGTAHWFLLFYGPYRHGQNRVGKVAGGALI